MYRKAEISKNDSVVEACRLALISMFISFAGWCFEKIARIIAYGADGDRGFLTLPLCPIYGISVVAIFLLCGTPTELSGPIGSRIRRTSLWKRLVKGKRWRKYAFYFVFVTVVSTAAELIVGLATKPFGIMLWDYSDKAFNFLGIICPSFSLLWGTLITLFMGFLWKPLYGMFSRLSRKTTVTAALTLSFAVAVDFTVNVIYALATGGRL